MGRKGQVARVLSHSGFREQHTIEMDESAIGQCYLRPIMIVCKSYVVVISVDSSIVA